MAPGSTCSWNTSGKGAEQFADNCKGLRCTVGVIYAAKRELSWKRTIEYIRELMAQEFPGVGVPFANLFDDI